jgi:hypothetical protein
MHYKTITLGLIEERPTFHQELRASRTMLATLNRYALELKASHEAWTETIARLRPDSGSQQIASEALEMAIRELQERLPSESDPEEVEALSLDAAMVYLRRPTPRV